MKKFLLIIFFIVFTFCFCNAQSDPGGTYNRLESIKMAYITNNVNLSPGEAQKFWPVYNNYNSELQKARQDYPGDVVGYESRVVEIRKKYQGQFQKVLNNPERVNKVFTSENNYRDLLRSEWQRRQQIRRQNQVEKMPKMRSGPQ